MNPFAMPGVCARAWYKKAAVILDEYLVETQEIQTISLIEDKQLFESI